MNKEEVAKCLRYFNIMNNPREYSVNNPLDDYDAVSYIKVFCDFTGHKMDEQDIANCVNYMKEHIVLR